MTSPIPPPSPTGLLRVFRHAALGTASAILFGAALGALIGATYWILFGWMLCGAAVALGLTVPAELEDSLGWGVFGAVPGSYLVGSSGHFTHFYALSASGEDEEVGRSTCRSDG
jgi:hypothetical protein